MNLIDIIISLLESSIAENNKKLSKFEILIK